MLVGPGGTAVSATVTADGVSADATMLVSGTAISTIVLGAGAVLSVAPGGATIGTIVSGGQESVAAGATASGTILSGGTEVVGGTAIGTTVDSGGFQEVSAGGTASGTTINGGTVEVQSGGSIGSGPITFTNAGGILELDDSQHFHGSIAGFASPSGVNEEIDLGDITFGKKTKVSFKEAKDNLSGTLTVTDGTHTATLTLLGQYSTSEFTIASDGNGGTMITDPAASTGGHPALATPA
jgi:autotransporter passenger strand-loop-strand repeat protein